MWSDSDERQLQGFARDALTRGLDGALVDSPSAGSRRRWERIVGLGWTGAMVPEDRGGDGAPAVELGTILKELGRVLADDPILSSLVLSTVLLSSLPQSEAVDVLLGQLATGEKVSVTTAADRAAHFVFTSSSGTRPSISGHSEYVLDMDMADVVLVHALDENGQSVLVALDSSRVDASPVQLLDESRRMFSIDLDAARVEESDILSRGDEVDRAIELMGAWGSFALACDSLGLAEFALEATVDYVKTREQFGRPVGSFQAVKHACTKMLVRTELARALVAECAVSLTASTAHAFDDCHMARLLSCDVAAEVTAEAIQLFGGVGFTWEYPIHRYLKRAKLNQVILDSPRHAEQLVFEGVLRPMMSATAAAS